MDAGGAAGDRKRSGRSWRRRANGEHRDADDGAARRSRSQHGADGRAASGGGCVPAIRHGSPRRRTAVLTWVAQRPRRAGPPRAADGAGIEGRRSGCHRSEHVHDPRDHFERAWPPDWRLQPRAPRPHRLGGSSRNGPHERRQPYPSGSGRASARKPHRTVGHLAARRLHRRVRDGPVVPGHRRRGRPGLRARRELSQHGRPGHRDSGRDRGVERHARLRAPEDAQHRGAQVRRRPQPADHQRLHAAGDGAWPRGKPAWRGAGERGDRRRSLGDRPLDAAARRGGVRGERERRGAGRRDRRARLAAVFGGAVAAHPARQTLAASPRRTGARPFRLDAHCRDGVRDGGPRRADGLAGVVASHRLDRLRGLLRGRVRPAIRRPRR